MTVPCSVRAVYARIQWIRGMCSDEVQHAAIDRELVAVLDMLKPPQSPPGRCADCGDRIEVQKGTDGPVPCPYEDKCEGWAT